ncbi:MAG TPA: indole-3-glycerol phosphate synthase TrpC [Alphaproteobacteria bacterium]|jgi:indole-3-glycerol phosphate synthase|nr:indole-3-glycerol phosphate synthase TrpC [Alphaproteobacteria bacterium]
MSNVLTEILAAKADHVAACERRVPQDKIEHLATQAAAPRGFAQALRETAAVGRFALIAEMKRKSPSGGEIRPGFDPAEVAQLYQTAGATCLSVLTDTPYFAGRDEDLRAARAATSMPALRKDFMIDPYQIAESRALGADCVLLIVAALDDGQLAELLAEARRWKMDALIEVHDDEELDRALKLDGDFIGINNRNLKTLKTSLETFEHLAPRVPAGKLLVAESGLRDTADLRRMADAHAGAFLVGESLLRQPDLIGATRALLGTA